VLGAVYAYLYYTRINPHRSARGKYLEQAGGAGGDDGGGGATKTHMLLFRKA
jgi:hypothetical protein